MSSNLISAGEVQGDPRTNHHEPDGGREEQAARERSVARWRLLWESRRLLMRACGIGLALALAAAFLIPVRYRSAARLMPPDEGSGMNLTMLAAATSFSSSGTGSNVSSQLGPGLGSIAGDLLGLKNSSDLFVGVLRSRTIQDDLIHKFDLQREYHDRKMADARSDLDDHTSFGVDRKSGIITIEVSDHDPKRAAAMAGEYVSELNNVVAHLNTSAAHRERVFLETRLTQVKDDLESAEKQFSVFAAKNTTIDMQDQAKAMLESGAALQGQLIAAQTELQGLRQIYSDSNVRVRAVQARVDEIQRQLQKIGGSYTDNPSTQVQKASSESLYPPIRQLPLLGVSYADLYRNTRVQEAIFEVLTKEYELAKVEEAKETPSVKVLDSPDVPDKRSFPPRLLILCAGPILAFAGCAFYLSGKTQWDALEQSDARKALALEVYETVRTRLAKPSSNGCNGGHA